ncbi:hypothetical protein LCE31_05320, partial [Streptomyces sp. 8L]|nr:hypothetical protein [Streptomyces sp. 8L]
MADRTVVPVGVRLSTDIEYRPDRPNPYRTRARWFDPTTKRRLSVSEGMADEGEAQEWPQAILEAAQAGLSLALATTSLAEYGNANMTLALRGLELKTLDLGHARPTGRCTRRRLLQPLPGLGRRRPLRREHRRPDRRSLRLPRRRHRHQPMD